MLRVESTALIIVDVQEKLFRVIHEKEKLLEDLQRLVRGALALDIPVIVTEQNPNGLGKTLPQISELLPEVSAVPKISFSCCGEAAFNGELEALQRKDLLLTGIETHICVYQTAVELLAGGYRVQVVADGVSSRTACNRDIALEKMSRAGVGITSVEMALFELLGTAGSDRFREISRIIR